jgi:hypothetical protein
MKKTKSNCITKLALVSLIISILSVSVYSANESTPLIPSSNNSSFTSNIDIDGNEEFDALTDGLLILRSMFGLDGSALVTGTIASDAIYTDSRRLF